MVIVKLVVMFEREELTWRPSGDSGGTGSTKRSPDHEHYGYYVFIMCYYV